MIVLLLSRWRVRLGALVCLAAGLGCLSNTLSDHVGYGASLVAALVASVVAGLGGAALGHTLRSRPDDRAGTALVTAAGLAVALVALTLVPVFVRGLLGDACGPARGVAAVLLVALPGPVLAALLGLVAGAALPRSRWATAVAAALVPGAVVWSLVRFYATPTIFAYDPFFGFYPGAIYDERVTLGATLVSYRVGTLGWIAAAAAAFVLLRDRASRGALALGLVGLAMGVGVYLAGPALGHRQGVDDLSRALAGTAWSRRCVVRYDASLDARQARRTARDCDLRVAQLEAFYGVRAPRRVTVFLFANAAQKAALMGAADTYIAKPWRSEVYLQYAPSPHPVLKHELAHVVAGAMAPGPLQVTARGRLLPVPGLIEGAAVAAAWEGEGGDTTPHQWSRAMLEAGMAPRVASLTSLGFFASASGTAYTAAGSFCRWLHAAHGAARFRAVYASGDFEAVYGRPLSALESEWHDFLRTVPTPEAVLVRARTRFRRASIFGRACPFDLDELSQEAARHLASGELDAASRAYAVLLGRDPTGLRARMGAAVTRVRRGDVAGADAEAVAAGRALGPAAETRMRTLVADTLWRWHGPSPALVARYAALDASQMDEDEARTLVLKRAALAAGGALAEGLRDLLLGREEAEAAPAVAAARLVTLASHDPYAAYLVARQMFLHERLDDVPAMLPDAVLAAMPDARVRAEALRMRAVASTWLARWDAADADFVRLADDPARPEGLREVARDWRDRIRWERTAPR